MKTLHYIISLGLLITLVWSCQNEKPASTKEPETLAEAVEPDYPATLIKVFEAHGGIDNWRVMNSLYFEIPKESSSEKHYIQLPDRRDRVEGANFVMGFDGDQVWLQADSTYEGNAVFYHNLMFYFYAMPFVLGDEGIIYTETPPLEYDGQSFPGLRISYQDGVGSSSKDEYYIHFDPETYEMAWLGYTVTYFSQESSDDVHWIRYDDWQQLSGLKLPKSISWYNYKDGLPIDFRNTVEFTNVAISSNDHHSELFNKPDGAMLP